MRFSQFCICLCILFPVIFPVKGQTPYHLRGKVVDTGTGSPIEDVVVLIGEHQQKTTGKQGDFSFRLTPGNYLLRTRHLAYEDAEFSFQLTGDDTVLLRLTPLARELDETIVRHAGNRQKISGLSGGRIDLNMEELKGLPKFMGTNDPLKILQLTPGIQTAGEGNSGIFIRGGEPGHNLILWNEAPIYNASHLLGLFSIFNTGHIGTFKLHKSNMQADRGGRLSSLLEITSPEKIPEKTTISGDIGLISSQATLALPLSGKTAVYLSGRKTYVGLTLKPFIRSMVSNKGNEMPFDYEFQDYNFSLVSKPSDRDQISFNAYWGGDKLRIEDEDYMLDGKLEWWNLASSLSWQHRWEKGLSMKNTLFMSQYRNTLHIRQNSLSARLPSDIRDWGFRNRFSFHQSGIHFTAGAEYIYHTVRPQSPAIEAREGQWGDSEVQTYHTHETAVFLTARFHPIPRLTTELGVRYSFHFQTGPYDDFQYNEHGEVIASNHFGRGKAFGFKHAPEPRISLRYTPGENNSVQFSYNRQRQFINLVSISGVGLPTDFWVPASKNIPVQTGDNFSLGYFQSLWSNAYEFSTEVYYRRMNHQMEYKSNLFDLFNQQYILEKSINYGKGKAYGVEFMLKKNWGKLNGWIGYTLGWSKRFFPAIREGNAFPAKHDRRHDLSLVASYKLNEKWDFSSVFVYATGNAFTMPQGIYMTEGNIVKEYGKYNGARMPAYHRLDISANYWFFKQKNRESGLNFSIYNVYKHSNPMYIFIVAKPSEHGNNQIGIKQKDKRLYDIIPSVSWTFKF